MKEKTLNTVHTIRRRWIMKKVTLLAVLTAIFVVALGMAAVAGPSFKPSLYGYIKLDGSYDQNLTSHGNFVMWVQQRENAQDDEQFNMTHKQSRFGFNLKGEGYGNVNVGAKAEVDLYGAGGGENKAELLLRHAYFWVESNGFKLLAGQNWDMVSPLNPSTLNYAVLWGCGNLGYRRPQVSLWYNFPAGNQFDVTIGAGAFRNIGDDLISLSLAAGGESADGADDGTDSGIPNAQGIFDCKYSWAEKGYFQFGVSGLWGQLKAETDAGNSADYESWAYAGHFQLAFPQGFGFSGEYYTGQNTGGFNGGIGLASTVDGVEAKGGWVSAWAPVSPKFKVSAGYGFDDPEDNDIADNTRAKNTCYYGNIVYTIVPQASVGLEVAQWETEFKAADAAKNLRVQSSFMLNF